MARILCTVLIACVVWQVTVSTVDSNEVLYCKLVDCEIPKLMMLLPAKADAAAAEAAATAEAAEAEAAKEALAATKIQSVHRARMVKWQVQGVKEVKELGSQRRRQ